MVLHAAGKFKSKKKVGPILLRMKTGRADTNETSTFPLSTITFPPFFSTRHKSSHNQDDDAFVRRNKNNFGIPEAETTTLSFEQQAAESLKEGVVDLLRGVIEGQQRSSLVFERVISTIDLSVLNTVMMPSAGDLLYDQLAEADGEQVRQRRRRKRRGRRKRKRRRRGEMVFTVVLHP